LSESFVLFFAENVLRVLTPLVVLMLSVFLSRLTGVNLVLVLEYLGFNKVIHRDIKVYNIFKLARKLSIERRFSFKVG